MQATSLNAPVHRTMLNRGLPMVAPPPVDTVLSAPSSGTQPPSTLDHELRRGIDSSYVRSREDAWTWFREGQYRRAARAFESAMILKPADFESRLGTFFCHLSLRAMRTSVALLGEIRRREANPFLHDLNMVQRYGGVIDARQARIQAQLFAQANRDVDAAAALHAIALWYLGEREEAVLVAESITGAHPDSVYADWPARMTAALKTVTPIERQP